MSTAAELAGFAAVSAAAWQLHPIAGLFTAGFSLILAGWATEDTQAVLRYRRITGLLAANRRANKQRRATKKAAKTPKAA